MVSIEGFVTRAQAGLVAPRSFSRNITPQYGGAVGHWGGTRQWIGNHARCLEIWRNWQRFHMVDRGWADIAYTGGYCNHGFAVAGRGFFVRTAANGTNVGNQNNYAFVWIGGQGDPHPNELAISAFEWWVQEARSAGGAGKRVRPHTDFTGSTCPGPQLTPHCRRMDNRDIMVPSKPAPKDPFDEWWDSMNDNQRKVLTDMADAIIAEKTNGGSFVRQLLKRHREDIPNLTEWVDRFNGLVEKGQTSLQGVVVGGINAIDAVRDMGYRITTSERTGPQKDS